MTPLHMAAESNCFEIAELLIRSGADVNAVERVVSSALIQMYDNALSSHDIEPILLV